MPVYVVTTSGSGLDPDTLDRQRTLAGEAGRGCVWAGREEGARPHRRAHTDGRPLGFMGEKTVNVLDLNLSCGMCEVVTPLAPPGA